MSGLSYLSGFRLQSMLEPQIFSLLNRVVFESIVILCVCGLTFLPVFGLTTFHVSLASRGRTTYEQARTSKLSFIIMGIDFLAFFPVLILAVFHMSLVSRGRTTNEQVTGKFRSGHNPFDDGCWNNCIQVFCASLPPRGDIRDIPGISIIRIGSSWQQLLNTNPLATVQMNHLHVEENHTASYPAGDARSLGEASQGEDCEAEPPPPPPISSVNQVHLYQIQQNSRSSPTSQSKHIRYSRKDTSFSNDSKSTSPSHSSSDVLTSPKSRRGKFDWESSSTTPSSSSAKSQGVGNHVTNSHQPAGMAGNHYSKRSNGHGPNHLPYPSGRHLPQSPPQIANGESSRVRRPISFVTALKANEDSEDGESVERGGGAHTGYPVNHSGRARHYVHHKSPQSKHGMAYETDGRTVFSTYEVSV
ncbi:Palmitoyltransferase ZDHHC5 [Holothuria leucospilota]|uniref:Palmitoyltransferase ZDHHC5 n=1 Tax=Holothuria leucospilota TaxID=206669 RepID=A0A9Q1CER7_HOLLE|nr:Palmitoyltransferase ZDHHC5 [Holothuria leucospilota]